MNYYLYLFPILLVAINGFNETKNSNLRQKRVLGVFTVVKFPNSACAASTTSRNGTCFTESECTSKGGYGSGSCASSFGVCCIIEKSCGGSTSDNCTYFTSSGGVAGQNCALEVCKCSSDVCQLRLDFDSFVINDPITTTTTTSIATNQVIIADGVGTAQAVNERGKCAIDSFQVFGDTTLSANPPKICGINTGQHMYVDASSQCNILQMGFGSGTSVSSANMASAVSIKVTQVKCNSKMEAPDGCLQYFTEDTGTIQSFNNGGTGIHLVSQDYRMCIRPNRGMCSICYSQPTANFGLGVYKAAADAAIAISDTYCGTLNEEGSADFITIPAAGCPPLVTDGGFKGTADRYCGTQLVCVLNTQLVATTPANAINTVCSMQKPFRIDVFTDMWEAALAATAEGGGTAATEQTGFKMDYWQTTSCLPVVQDA